MIKGYLGPLGDDFPAIFPIALGLMFFFGAITITYQNYDMKQEMTTLMRANLALSKAVRTQLEFDPEFWETACNVLEDTKANYGVMAKMGIIEVKYVEDGKYKTNPEYEGYELEEYIYYDDNGYPKTIEPCGDLMEKGKPIPKENDFVVVMYYPVIIKESGVNKPVTLVIMTWKA